MIKLTNTAPPKEDLIIFRMLCSYVGLLPERLDLMPEDDDQESWMYSSNVYNRMLLRALATEFGLEVGFVLAGGLPHQKLTSIPVLSLILPGGSRFALGMPGTISAGPILFLQDEIAGVNFEPANPKILEDQPKWFHRGAGLFREAIRARASEHPREQIQPI